MTAIVALRPQMMRIDGSDSRMFFFFSNVTSLWYHRFSFVVACAVGVAAQVITLFPDLTLAVEEGEPDLARDFFATVKVGPAYVAVLCTDASVFFLLISDRHE